MAKISAGRIVLPDIVQNLSFNVSGEEKLKTIGRALNDIASGTKAHEYISDQETMIRRLISSYEDYNRITSKNNAGELIKSFNALKAVSDGIDLSKIVADFERVDAAYQKASQDFGKDFTGFSADRFRDVAEAMSELAHYGVDVNKVFERLGQSSNVGKLHEQIRELELATGRLRRELYAVTEERDNLLNGAELQRLQEIEYKFQSITETMANEFRSFLHANDLDSGDDAWNRYYDYFEAIKNGSMTAKEAITNVRTELAEMIQTAQPGDTVFSSTQMDEFISKLDIACRSIELMRSEIEDLNNKAVMRGAAQEMAESAELTEKQREAMHGLVQESTGLNNVSQILVALVENFDTTDERIQTSVNSFNNLLNILDSIAHVEPANMSGFNDVLKNLRMISEFNIDSKKMAELEAALSSLAKIPNLSNLATLGNVDLRGFNDLSASKASLNNLATYLPELSQNVNVEKLRALSQISLANFSSENLKVSKASMDHLRELILTINGNELDQTKVGANAGQDALVAKVEKVSQAVKNESAAMREASEAKEADVASAEAAAKAEEDKRKISELLAEALKREEEAARKAGESAEQDAEKTKKAGQAAEEATASVDKLSSIWDKMFLGKFSAELVKVQEQFSALQEKPEKLAQNMQLLEKAEREMREATSMEGKLEAYNRFSTILDVVRSQIGAVNAEAKNSNTDFRNLLNMVKQANSAMEGIGNSSFTNKLREMSAKTKGIADESVIQNLTRMRQAYVDMQSAYGTGGPSSTQDYEALINAHIRWKEALNGLNQALAANRAETSANKQSNTAAAQAAREIANGAAAAEKQIASLNAVFESLRDKTKFDTSSFEQMKALLDTVNNTSLDTTTRQSALQQLNEMINATSASMKELADAEKAEANAAEEAKNAASRKASYAKQLNTLLVQCENAERKYAAAAKLSNARENYEGIKQTKEAVKELLIQLDSESPKLDEIKAKIQQLSAAYSTNSTALRTNGSLLSSYVTTGMQQLKSRLTYSLGLAAMVYKSVNEIKKMISTAVELDSAMNELQIVTRASGAEMEEYGRRVSSMAKETAQATKDLIEATTVYARLGYSMDESSMLSKYTAMLQGVGDIGASEAQDAMTAIIKAFNKNVNDIEDVMDKLVRVGNNYPISVSQLAEGMNNASSMLAVAGNSFEESVALLTAANTTIQNVSKASTGLRTIAARIRKTTTGEDDEGEIVEEAKYQEMLNALTKHHVSLVDEVTGEYRSTYEVIRDIARVWNDLTSMEQAAVIEALAGTRQQNIFTSLVTQFQEAEGALNDMNNATGELQESYDIYLDSIQAHVQRMKAAYDELSRDFVSSDLAKLAVDLLTKIIEGLDWLVKKLGAIGTFASGVAIVKLIKNFTALKTAILGVSAAQATMAASGGMAFMATSGTGIALSAMLPTLAAVAAAIALLTLGFIQAKKAYDKAHPSLEQLKKDAGEAKEKVDSLKQSISTNTSRLEELYELRKNGKLSVADQEELEQLERENELLSAQLELEKELADIAQNKVRKSVNKELGTFFGPGTDTVVDYDWNVQEVQHTDSGIEHADKLIGQYLDTLEEIRETEDQIIEDGKATEEQLEHREELAGQELEKRQELLEIQRWLMEQKSELIGATDEESIQNLRLINNLIDRISKTTKNGGKSFDDFKKKLDSLDDNALKYLAGETSDAAEAQKELARWMQETGYTADEVQRYLREYSEELRNSSDSQTGAALEHNISQWGTMADEIERAKAAIDKYNQALEGGNNGEIAGQMQDAWQKAMEEIESGRIDSRAAWAFYEMAFTPEQINAMGRDAEKLAKAIKSRFFREMYDDSNTENGFSDEDNPLSIGQRLLNQMEENQDQWSAVRVWRNADGAIKFVIEDFDLLAEQIGISRGMLDAMLDDLDPYGKQLLSDTTQISKLVESLLSFTSSTDDAREAVKNFIADAFSHDENIDDMTMARILDKLHELGYLSIDTSEYWAMIQEVRNENKELEDESPTISPRASDTLLANDINTILRNFQTFLNNNPLIVPVAGGSTGTQAQSTGTGTQSQNSNAGSHAGGTFATAGGKSPGSGGGKTLVNELGPELISDEGRAYIANGGKPGFVDLSKNAIVFTADETDDILHGKKTVNAKARAEGAGRAGLIGRLLGRGTQARGIPIIANTWTCPRCSTIWNNSVTRCTRCGWTKSGQNWQCWSCTWWNPTSIGTCSKCGASRYGTQPATPTTPTVPDPQDGNLTPIYTPGHTTGGGVGGGSSSQSVAEPQKIDWIAVRLSRIQRVIQDLEKVASSGFKRLTTRLDASKDEVVKLKEEIVNQQEGYYRYIQEAGKVGLSDDLAQLVREGDIDIEKYDDETRKKIQEYQEWYEKALACESAIEDLHQAIAQLYQAAFDNTQTDFENRLAEIEHAAAMAQKNIDMASAKGYLDSAKFYEQMADIEVENINMLRAELAALNLRFQEAMDSGEIETGSEAWYAMQQAIHEVEEAIADANIQLVEYQRMIRSINWSYFDYAQERFSQLSSEAEFLINLMSNHDLFQENGQFNDLGAATAGMHAVSYDVYMAQAEEYAKEIQKISNELLNDPADTELIERRETLLGLQRQSILSAEAEKNAVRDLVQNGISKELEALKDLIDTYNDSIDSAKDLYEYQKKVAEQTANIATIEKQLSAYAGDTSEETRAKIQKLNKELEDAQTTLSETERDQSISDQKKLLDNLYDEYEALLNARLDNIDLLMQEIVTGTNENMDDIRNTLIEVGDEVGYTLTDQMQQALQGDLGYYDHVFDGINSIQVVLEDIYRMVGAMAEASGAVKAYATGGLVDYTGLAAVHGTAQRPELMLNAGDTENFLEAARMMRSLLTTPQSAPVPVGTGGGGGLSIGQLQLNIPIERVQDYNDFVTQLRDDPKFERLIGAMTLDRVAGKSGFEKNRIRF